MTTTVAPPAERVRTTPGGAASGWRLNRHSLPAAVVLILIGALGFVRRTDPDFWWHLQAGRDILASGGLPRVDAYSHTMGGQPWVAHSWLFEVVLALLMGSVGYVGVSALLSALL